MIGLPTSEHVLFIPAVLLVGIVVGWMLGARATRHQLLRQRAKTRE